MPKPGFELALAPLFEPPPLPCGGGGAYTFLTADAGAATARALTYAPQQSACNAAGAARCTGAAASRPVAISAGLLHTCLLGSAAAGGGLLCAGSNYRGQLGFDNGARPSPELAAVALPVGGGGGGGNGALAGHAAGGDGGAAARAVAAGAFHTCAIASGGADADGDGVLYCWGQNEYGQLGDGAASDARATPVAVRSGPLARGARAVAAGKDHTCAIASDSGGVACFGRANYGQAGVAEADAEFSPAGFIQPAPRLVGGLEAGAVALAAGGSHTCAVTAAGALRCFGSNAVGQLGVEPAATPYTHVPIAVPGLEAGVVAAAAGASHTCAITEAGALQCFGSNSHGQLGRGAGAPLSAFRPAAVASPALAGGGEAHTCAVTRAGALLCWGHNQFGQLGLNDTAHRAAPVPVPGLSSGVVAVAAGAYHTCAAKADGAVACFGANAFGQLAVGDAGGARPAPARVPGAAAAAPSDVFAEVRAAAAGGPASAGGSGGGDGAGESKGGARFGANSAASPLLAATLKIKVTTTVACGGAG